MQSSHTKFVQKRRRRGQRRRIILSQVLAVHLGTDREVDSFITIDIGEFGEQANALMMLTIC